MDETNEKKSTETTDGAKSLKRGVDARRAVEREIRAPGRRSVPRSAF